MKFTQLKNGQTYRRKTDDKIFKLDGDQYYVATEQGLWEKTEDLNLRDEFEPSAAPNVTSYNVMFHKYKNGTLEERQRYLDKIIQAAANALDVLIKKGILDEEEK